MFDFCGDDSEEPMTYTDKKMLEVNKLITGRIKQIPTADVVERKTGKWVGKPIAGFSNVRCSNCNNVYLNNSGKWHYCPNCGASMRKETENE